MRRIACGMVASFFMAAALVACVSGLLWSPSARAEGSSQPYSMGGAINPKQIVAQYNQTGERFRIEGYCRSSCTFLLAIKNACVDPNATLAFHAAILSPKQPVSAEHNKKVANFFYNARLRAFVMANHYMDSWDFHTISGSDIIHKFGYRQCPPK